MTDLKDKISSYDERPIPRGKIAEAIAFASRIADEQDYEFIEYLASLDDLYDDFYASLAMAALPGWEEKGIDRLLKFAFSTTSKNRTRSRAIEVLLAVASGELPNSKSVLFLEKEWDNSKHYNLSSELVTYCLRGLRENLLAAFGDEYQRADILFNLGMMSMTSGTEYKDTDNKNLEFFLSLIVDNQLILNKKVLEEFESLLNSKPTNEEVLQKYLTVHPILLDPFVTELFTKQQFGTDFITDFVIKRLNNQYVLVEIESSTDIIFTSSGSFSSHLTTALGQVRDFQAWVSDNLEYSRKKMPGIKHPEGIVIIGRKTKLSEIELKRLSEENFSRRGHTKILTYDDLLETAKAVYSNILTRPIIHTTKDLKSI